MVDLRIRPEKCERCNEGQAFMIWRNAVGKSIWLCKDCVDVFIEFGSKALEKRDSDRSGNGG